MDEGKQIKGTAARKRARSILISSVILLILCIAAGVLYTWYTDQTTPVKKTAKTTVQQPLTADFKPPKVPDSAPEGVSLVGLTSPIAQGQNASLQLHTNPNSTCNFSLGPGASAAHDANLADKTADDFGSINWSWAVPATAADGKYAIKVTCSFHGHSGVYEDQLVISRTAQS